MIIAQPLNPYLDDILHQPQAVVATLEGLRSTPGLDVYRQGLASGKLTRVVLTGMGSSYYAMHPLHLRLTARGIPTWQVETSELIHYHPALIDPTTLLVIASQSGRSAETIHLLQLCAGRAPLVGITNTPESPLARQASVALVTRAGKEASVSCKTYHATLAALSWLGDELAREDGQSWFSALAEAPPAIARYQAEWQEHVRQLKRELAGVRQVFLIGRGASLAATGTGGLILKEAARFPAEGMSSAAFRHGPLEIVSPQVFTLVFSGDPQTAGLNRQLAQDIQKAGGGAALVESGAGAGLFMLPTAPQPVLPLLEILPVQMLSLALAEMQGIVPGEFRLASKVTLVE